MFSGLGWVWWWPVLPFFLNLPGLDRAEYVSEDCHFRGSHRDRGGLQEAEVLVLSLPHYVHLGSHLNHSLHASFLIPWIRMATMCLNCFTQCWREYTEKTDSKNFWEVKIVILLRVIPGLNCFHTVSFASLLPTSCDGYLLSCLPWPSLQEIAAMMLNATLPPGHRRRPLTQARPSDLTPSNGIMERFRDWVVSGLGSLHYPVLCTPGQLCSPGDIWQNIDSFLVVRLRRGYYWHLVGGYQRCC